MGRQVRLTTINDWGLMTRGRQPGEGKARVLDAGLHVFRAKGYAATTVDDLCSVAGVTKGTFFHYFKTKEDLALAAADYWGEMVDREFASAPYQQLTDPVERVLGYIDYRRSLLRGDLADYTCLLGTLVQETYDLHPRIRVACDRHISGPAGLLAADIAAAMQSRDIQADWTAESLALFTQSVLQGAFVLAKAKQGPQVAIDSVDHLRRYLELLFTKGDGL